MHRNKIIFVLVLLFFGSITVFTLNSRAQQNMAQVTNRITSGLRLRQAPVDGVILRTLAPGTQVSIVGQNDDRSWLQVTTTDGVTGWVSADYIEPLGASAPAPVLPAGPVVVESAGSAVANPGAFNAEVVWSVGMLNMRSAPGTNTDVIFQIPGGTPLNITGRTADNTWLKARTADGAEGWVIATYVQVNTDLNQVANEAPAVVPIDFSNVVSNITSKSRQIFNTGQSLGNRPDVFSKIGDSITVSQYMLYPIGWGRYDLQGYGHLQPVIDYYLGGYARTSNSFANTSLSAVAGWSTEHALMARFADPGVCAAGEAPLACEYRVVKPSVAIIMYGTNDAGYMPMQTYKNNLSTIVQISIDNGVIPILSTIPNRPTVQGNVDEVNRLIWSTAREYGVPIVDYGGAMSRLPNAGLAGDGVHPSEPPGGYVGAATFTPENLQYGYTVRNITTLYALDAVWRQIILAG